MLQNQSQKHGYIFEERIKNIFGCEYKDNDTGKYDIPCEFNKIDSNENCSIKITKSNNIDCGDILRFFTLDNNPIHKTTIIIGKYIQHTPQTKKINKIYEINYTQELHKLLFGNITKEELENYINKVKNIPHGKNYDKTYLAEKCELQKKYNMKINISPKVDSKKQRRVQCSIPNFEELLKKFIIKIYEPINDNILYRNKLIERIINSGIRKLK